MIKQIAGIWVLGFALMLGWHFRPQQMPAHMGFFQSAPISITSSLQLTWNQTGDATSWNIKRSLVHLGPYTTIATGVLAPIYIDSTVRPKTTYYYVISATNVVGTSSDSSEVQGTTP